VNRLVKVVVTAVVAGGLIIAGLPLVVLAGQMPAYQKASGVSGNLNFIGSDTLLNLMTLLGEAFGKVYPNVRVQGEGKGSSTAPPALIEGTAQLGPMSREMKASEIDAFEAKFGYKPTGFRVALDALAVYVNKDNPIAERGLTLQQIDAIFSKTRKGGHPTDVTTWGQLGLTGDWADKPISLYGRNSASGTYGYFKEHALYKGDYKDTVKEQPGSASVVQGVENDRYGIGYSGMGYSTSGVKKVPVAQGPDGKYAKAELESVLSGDYALGRFLYIYVNKSPGAELDPLVREFMAFAYSQEGQEQVQKAGFIPTPPSAVAEELTMLGIDASAHATR
jgi:phosphate transport system substrate-binding protein